MADKIPDDVAYTITTGYYPEIASSVKYGGKKKGSGPVGAKFAQKRGFTANSVGREAYSMMSYEQKETGALAYLQDEAFNPLGDYIKILGIDKNAKRDITEVGLGQIEHHEERYKFKFMGGTETYKLYGDQVWYMAGKRNNKEMVTNFLEDSNMTGVQYQQVYSNTEPLLIKHAKKFAEEIFEDSYDVATIQKHFEDSSVDIAEEIGFSEGGFDYMTVDMAIKKGFLDARTDSSKANNRDMVKVKDGVVQATYDVTERSIQDVGQHGITRKPPDALVQAIKDIEKGGGVDKQLLKTQVMKMYVGQIKNDYNPMIKELKKAAGLGHKVQGGLNAWDGLLQEIPSATSRVGTPDLARAVHLKMGKYTFLKEAEKTTQQTSIELIAHLLGTLNAETNAKFVQAHRVATRPDGRKVYASVPMKTSEATLLFLESAVKRTKIVEGYSYTNAIAYGKSVRNRQKGAAMSRSGKLAYTASKMGTTAITKGSAVGSANAQMNLRAGVAPSTVASIPAGDKLTKKLISVLNGAAIPNLMKIKGMSGKALAARRHSLKQKELAARSPNRMRNKKMRLGGDMSNNGMFWALPYIGVTQSEYVEE
jgi:ribulose bisphosphate carboxylase small subunit